MNFQNIESYHSPNEGRAIINNNFNSIDELIISGSNDYATTGVTLNETVLTFDRNDTLSAYSVDLSSLVGSSDYSSNVVVVASTPDDYIGVGTPTISEYNSSVIYQTTFDITNITTAVTINIDGVRQLLIKI